MKFYDCKTAPSPRRARMFIAEKGLAIETVEVDLAHGEQFTDAFLRINPRGTVPVLETDDGTYLTENLGIAAYLEAIQPEPTLLGSSPTDKGLILTWNARAELEGLLSVADAFRNRSKGLKDHALTGPVKHAQIPELAERGRARATEFLETLDNRLEEFRYVAGARFSLADITALCVVQFAAGVIKLSIADDQINLRRWHDECAARPSAHV